MSRVEAGIKLAISMLKISSTLLNDFPHVKAIFNKTMSIVPHSMFTTSQSKLVEKGINKLVKKMDKKKFTKKQIEAAASNV